MFKLLKIIDVDCEMLNGLTKHFFIKLFLKGIVLFGFPGYGFGQNLNIDSVFNEAQALSPNAQIETYLKLTNNENLRLLQKLRMADSAVNLSVVVGDKKLLFRAYYEKAMAHINMNQTGLARENLTIAEGYIAKGDLNAKAKLDFAYGDILLGSHKYDSAIAVVSNGLELTVVLNDSVHIATAYTHLGYCYFVSSEFNKSIEAYINALAYNSTIKTESIYVSSYSNIGLCYLRMDDYTNALKYLLLALEYKAGNSVNVGNLFTSIAIIYAETEKYDKALQYFNMSIENFYLWGDSVSIAGTYSNLGTLYITIGDTLKAIEKINSSIGFFRKLDMDVQSALIALNLADIFEGMGQPDSAIKILDYSEKVLARHGNKYHLALVYSNKGHIYAKAGNVDKTNKYLANAKALAGEIHSPSIIKQVYQGYYLLNKKLGNFEKSLTYYIQYRTLNDSIESAESKNKIEEMLTKYQTREKEKENRLLKQELLISRQKAAQQKLKSQVFFIFVILLVLMIFFVIYIFKVRQRKMKERRILNEARLEIMKKNLKIAEHEKTISEQNNILLKEDLERKTVFAEATASQLLKNSEITTALIDGIKSLKPYTNSEGQHMIRTTLTKMSGFTSLQNWEIFYRDFSALNKGFFEQLDNLPESLTENEKKVICFIKMGLNTKKIAAITFQSINSINVAKNRLRKKFNIENIEGLQKYFNEM